MRSRRVVPLVVAALFLGAGMAIWQRETRPAATVNATAALLPVPAKRMAAQAVPTRVVEFLQVPVVAAVKCAPVTLPASETAIAAEVIALQLLAPEAELELSARQWAVLAAVTSNIQAVRHAYEASLAKAAVLAPGHYRLEIPAYAAAGDALRARLHADLREQLGEANTTEILARLGSRLEGHFAGFGVSVQTLEVTGDVNNRNADWQVTRTVKFWNSVEGQDRLTTRRETHFPGREDPAGETWGPLLSVLSAPASGGAGS